VKYTWANIRRQLRRASKEVASWPAEKRARIVLTSSPAAPPDTTPERAKETP